MYLILCKKKEEDAWVLHTKSTKKEEELWTETEAVVEIKSLMERDLDIKVYKVEKVKISIALESETG